MVVVVQWLSHVQFFATPWTGACQASLSFTISQCLLKLTGNVHCVNDAIQLSHPLSSLCPPDLSLSQHQDLLQWVGSLHQVAKVLVSASVLPMNIQGWFPLHIYWAFTLWQALDIHYLVPSPMNMSHPPHFIPEQRGPRRNRFKFFPLASDDRTRIQV